MHPDDAEVEAVVAAFEEVDAREEEEEDDPGELVSAWYTMKKAFETTLASLREAEANLNAIGDRLRTKHGIQVPTVTTGGAPEQPAQVIQAAPPAPSAEEAAPTPQDSSWSPPSQSPITIEAPQTGARFVEELRRDASLGDSEKGFADHVAKMFQSFSDFR